ncbi:CheY-like chemotaxis protein [Humitalea rosea]|uniref:CheY-like chemotaxis protein n=1 Tax=Humitalea rosea TaxID=990373 RepID=A0A2W7I3B6_9PROT|nr:response regulator [Humitalea rosea]PZW40808.1 CheY-like chemotaxis protein [Humitalea rosea]
MKALRVLVMEDEVLIGLLFAEILKELGHDVYAIESTEAGGIAAAARIRPELVIADGRLGKGSGIAAVEEILRGGFVPHVFVSGDVPSIKAQHPHAIVLQKPFQEPDLIRAIHAALAAPPIP